MSKLAEFCVFYFWTYANFKQLPMQHQYVQKCFWIGLKVNRLILKKKSADISIKILVNFRKDLLI